MSKEIGRLLSRVEGESVISSVTRFSNNIVGKLILLTAVAFIGFAAFEVYEKKRQEEIRNEYVLKGDKFNEILKLLSEINSESQLIMLDVDHYLIGSVRESEQDIESHRKEHIESYKELLKKLNITIDKISKYADNDEIYKDKFMYIVNKLMESNKVYNEIINYSDKRVYVVTDTIYIKLETSRGIILDLSKELSNLRVELYKDYEILRQKEMLEMDSIYKQSIYVLVAQLFLTLALFGILSLQMGI